MALAVGGEDVVVGYDGYSRGVPDSGVLAELFFEDADGAGAADIVRHQHLDLTPHVLAGRDLAFTGVGGEDFLGHGHLAGHLLNSQVLCEIESTIITASRPWLHGIAEIGLYLVRRTKVD